MRFRNYYFEYGRGLSGTLNVVTETVPAAYVYSFINKANAEQNWAWIMYRCSVMDKTVFEAAMTTATMDIAKIKVITDITGTAMNKESHQGFPFWWKERGYNDTSFYEENKL